MNDVQDNQREASLELAYLAGIVDGEGSISTKKDVSYFPTIQVGMTQLPAIELMVKRFGGKIREDLTSNRKSTMYRWETNKRAKVLEVLEALLPYLRVKHELALNTISFVLDGPQVVIGGQPKTSVQEQERRKELYWKVKELNNVRAPATTKRENNREVEAIV